MTEAVVSRAPGAVVTRYSTVAIALHWAIALLLIANIGLAWAFGNIPKGLLTFQLVQVHKSTGILILLLSLVRLGWRLAHPAPPYPAGLKPWEQALARAVHIGFYVVMIGMPLTGWVMVSGSKLNLPTRIYGLFTWPNLPFVHGATGATKAFWHTVGGMHDLGAKLAYALIVLHVAGALKHQFVDKDVIMSRMAPWFARR